ncbi:unnamed protein product [Durusdinium trenchii]|uniref:Uncharacterized protein n=1 Tax=Durusdinium trenchii TaxID=1381693 RepID=A0ABP0RFF4_9DINO
MLFAMSMTVAISGNRQKLSLAKLHCKMLVLKKLDAFEVRGCDLLLLFGTWPPIGKNGSQCCEARKLLVHVVGIWPISYAKLEQQPNTGLHPQGGKESRKPGHQVLRLRFVDFCHDGELRSPGS